MQLFEKLMPIKLMEKITNSDAGVYGIKQPHHDDKAK